MKRLPIKFRMPKSARTWAKGSTWREMLLTMVATTISIVLTFGTAGLLERCERIKDRKMSAMMVMSNIEQFAQELEKLSSNMAHLDSTATWMLSLPVDKLDLIPPEEVTDPINEIVTLDFLSHDKTTENIFGNSIETWKNMGYEGVQFIDNVGLCFAEMNDMESYWNDWVTDYESVFNEVISHMQPGEHTITKLLSDDAFRQKLESFHVRQYWLKYAAARCRYLNDKNMVLFKIDKESIMDFTEQRTREIDFNEKDPTVSQFRTEPLNPDSMTTLHGIKQHIDSIIYKK